MKKKELTEKQQRTIRIAAFATTVVLMVLAIVLVGIPLVKFLREPDLFRAWVRERGFWGKVAFVGMEVFKVVLVFLPGEPFELAAGYAFGAWEGLLLCMTGITIGSITVFLLVRRFGRSIVAIFFKKEQVDSMRFLKSSKKRNIILSVIYMLPGTPKDFLNYYAGLTDISIKVWLLVCSVGRIPSIITSTLTGNAFVERKYFLAVAITGGTFIVGAIGLLIYNRKVRVKNAEADSKAAEASESDAFQE